MVPSPFMHLSEKIKKQAHRSSNKSDKTGYDFIFVVYNCILATDIGYMTGETRTLK